MLRVLAPHEERVVQEHTELTEKHAKLNAFLATDTFKTLEPIDRNLLEKQAQLQYELICVLRDRISRFK